MTDKFSDDKDYLSGIFEFAEFIKEFSYPYGRKPEEAEEKRKNAIKLFDTLQKRASASLAAGLRLPLEAAIRRAKLTPLEVQILYMGLYCGIFESRDAFSTSQFAKAIAGVNKINGVKVLEHLRSDSPLIKRGFLVPTPNSNGLIPHQFLISEDIINKAMGARRSKTTKKKPCKVPVLPPTKLYAALNEYVVGQDAACRRVATAAFRHLKTCEINHSRKDGDKIQKSNVLIIGPTGTGKTHLCRTLSRALGVPFLACDATQYTETGYVGLNVEDMLVKLFKEAANSHEKMANGVIYIDEIDKLAARDSSRGHNTEKDVSGLSVQQELLKLLDGDKIYYRQHLGYMVTEHNFNVSGIMFIAGGAFSGLEEIIRARLNKKAGIGFTGAARIGQGVVPGACLDQVTTQDLVEYGFIPEFIGRFSSIVVLNSLSVADIKDILVKPRNCLISQ